MGQVSASSTILINADPKTVLNAVADYRDVRPISGVYSGARTTNMDVEVTLTRLG